MKRVWVIAALLSTLAVGDDKWLRLRSGPFEVLSNAGEKPARERLFEAEQFRQALGDVLGKKDLGSVWPIRMLVLKDKRAAVPGGIAMGRDSWMSAATSLEWRLACARIFIDDNANRLPPDIERGLIQLISTLDIKGTKLALGAPPAEKTRDWVRVWLLSTTPDYRGRMRVFISNVEQGADYDVAYKNAFEKRSAQLEKEVDAALASGKFDPVPVPGRALSEKDFTVREAPVHEGAIALADLAAADPSRASDAQKAYKAAGGVEGDEGLKQFAAATKAGSKNAKAWLALNTREGFLKAVELNPRWAEPHVKLAGLEQDPGRKATEFQKAVKLEPRNAALWKQLAMALMDARQYGMAAKAWTGAELASETSEERAAMHQARLDIESTRADFAESERKKRLEAEARDLQRVKNLALAEVREAEAKTNSKLHGERGEKPEEVVRFDDLDKPKRFEGSLEKVDCQPNGQAKLTVRGADKKPAVFIILKPDAIGIAGGGDKGLSCGVQAPARAVVIEYGSSRDVQTIEFK